MSEWTSTSDRKSKQTRTSSDEFESTSGRFVGQEGLGPDHKELGEGAALSRADVRQEQVQQALVAADAGATAVPGPVSCPREMEDFERGIFAALIRYM